MRTATSRRKASWLFGRKWEETRGRGVGRGSGRFGRALVRRYSAVCLIAHCARVVI